MAAKKTTLSQSKGTTRKITGKASTPKDASKLAKKSAVQKEKPTAKLSTQTKAGTKKTATNKSTVAKKTKDQTKVVSTKATPKRVVAIKKAMTKTELLNTIAKDVGLTRKEVASVFENLNYHIHAHLKGLGQFTLPNLLKIRVLRKPATKARKGLNLFTGEETVFKAKPARNVPKFRALKALKEMVQK